MASALTSLFSIIFDYDFIPPTCKKMSHVLKTHFIRLRGIARVILVMTLASHPLTRLHSVTQCAAPLRPFRSRRRRTVGPPSRCRCDRRSSYILAHALCCDEGFWAVGTGCRPKSSKASHTESSYA